MTRRRKEPVATAAQRRPVRHAQRVAADTLRETGLDTGLGIRLRSLRSPTPLPLIARHEAAHLVVALALGAHVWGAAVGTWKLTARSPVLADGFIAASGWREPVDRAAIAVAGSVADRWPIAAGDFLLFTGGRREAVGNKRDKRAWRKVWRAAWRAAVAEARRLLRTHRAAHRALAAELLRRRVLERGDILRLIRRVDPYLLPSRRPAASDRRFWQQQGRRAMATAARLWGLR
jgi:hypothetical protein